MDASADAREAGSRFLRLLWLSCLLGAAAPAAAPLDDAVLAALREREESEPAGGDRADRLALRGSGIGFGSNKEYFSEMA